MHKRVWLLIPAASLIWIATAHGAPGNSAVVHALSPLGVWTVIKDAAAPDGIRVEPEVSPRVDLELRCKRDGYRAHKILWHAAPSNQSTWRVTATDWIADSNNLRAAVKAACEAGRATVTFVADLAPQCKDHGNLLDLGEGIDWVEPSPRPAFQIQLKCQGAFAKAQDRAPLWLVWNPVKQDNESIQGYWPAQDRQFVRIQGEILRTQQPGTVALKRYQRVDGTGDFLVTTKDPGAAFKEYGVLGYVFAADKPQPLGTIALTRYYSSARKDYHLNESLAFNAAAEGYANPVLEGYIYKSE